jgi:NADH-quinone oxidoreductase subunit I
VTNKVEKLLFVVFALSCPAEAITMTAAERKRKHLYREEKYASIYEINMLRCIFLRLCEDACQKTLSIDYLKTLVASSYEEKILFMGRID